MSSTRRWNPTRDTTVPTKETLHVMHYRRPRSVCVSSIMTVVIHMIINQRQTYNTILSMPPNYNFRNAARIAPYGFPDSSRTMPTTTTTTTADPNNHVMITSRCSCGSVLVEFPYPKNNATASTLHQQIPVHSSSSMIDCHCPTCRRYHMAAFVRYLEVPANGVSVLGDSVVRYQDTCSEIGTVQRIYCRRCSSKLLTRRNVDSTLPHRPNNRRSMPPIPQQQQQVSQYSSQSTVLVNMGAIDNQSVPNNIMEQWRDTKAQQWSPHMEASWARTTLFDINDDDDTIDRVPKPPTIRVTGGCTCGKCRYEFDFHAPSEMQHCYCNLCRQLSGGMFMTWVPVNMKEHNFRWIDHSYVPDANQAYRASDDGPTAQLVRYTDIGKRHMCSQCGSNLSILYDTFDDEAEEEDEDEERVIWLSAAGFDSIRFPFRVEPYLSRLLHICCRFKPKWYRLPKDGIPRVRDASWPRSNKLNTVGKV